MFSGCATPCETSCRVDFGSTVLGFFDKRFVCWLCLVVFGEQLTRVRVCFASAPEWHFRIDIKSYHINATILLVNSLTRGFSGG